MGTRRTLHHSGRTSRAGEPRGLVRHGAGRGRVAEGQEISTEYGVYKAILGPSKDGDYFHLDCQGMRAIAGDLAEQPLNEVNRELRVSGLIDPATPSRSMLKEASGSACWDSRHPTRPCPDRDTALWDRSVPVSVWGHLSFQPSCMDSPSSSMMLQQHPPPTCPEKSGRRQQQYSRNPCLCRPTPAPGGGNQHSNPRHRQQQQSPRLMHGV